MKEVWPITYWGNINTAVIMVCISHNIGEFSDNLSISILVACSRQKTTFRLNKSRYYKGNKNNKLG